MIRPNVDAIENTRKARPLQGNMRSVPDPDTALERRRGRESLQRDGGRRIYFAGRTAEFAGLCGRGRPIALA